MPRAFGYVRVSKDEQDLQSQVRLIKTEFENSLLQRGYEWGTREGYPNLDGWFCDHGVSAYKKDFRNRPAGSRLNGVMRSGDIVIVVRTDRGWRRTVDCLDTLDAWLKRGIYCHVMSMKIDTSDPSGRLMLTIWAAFAEHERQMISARTKEALDARRARGTPYSKPPYGFMKGKPKADGTKTVVPNPKERELGSLIVKLMQNGMTAEQIRMQFLAQKVRSTRNSQNGHEIGTILIESWYKKELELRAREANGEVLTGLRY